MHSGNRNGCHHQCRTQVAGEDVRHGKMVMMTHPDWVGCFFFNLVFFYMYIILQYHSTSTVVPPNYQFFNLCTKNLKYLEHNYLYPSTHLLDSWVCTILYHSIIGLYQFIVRRKCYVTLYNQHGIVRGHISDTIYPIYCIYFTFILHTCLSLFGLPSCQ